MQNISAPPQANTSSSQTITPKNSAISNVNNQSNETFDKIIEQEVSSETITNQQDNNTIREMSASAEIANNSRNPQSGLKKLQGELFENTIIATRNEFPALSPEIDAPANNTDQLSSIDLMQPTDISTVTNTQAIASIFSQPAPTQKFHANNIPNLLYNTANFAASNKIMPPPTEVIENSTPLAGITSFALTSDTKLPVATDIALPLTVSTLPPTPQLIAFTPTEINIDAQLGQLKWNGEFTQKIVWLVGQQQQVAEIRLNPAHLGPIEIMLSITNDQGSQQATAQFLSSHLVVREAIEAALPKLREMMADNSITLGNVTIDSNLSQQQRDTWQQENTEKRFTADQLGTHSEFTDQQEPTIIASNQLGIVNTFA